MGVEAIGVRLNADGLEELGDGLLWLLSQLLVGDVDPGGAWICVDDGLEVCEGLMSRGGEVGAVGQIELIAVIVSERARETREADIAQVSLDMDDDRIRSNRAGEPDEEEVHWILVGDELGARVVSGLIEFGEVG